MVGWPHRLNGHEFEWTPGVGEGRGSLACCSPWGCKESDTTERPNSDSKGSKLQVMSLGDRHMFGQTYWNWSLTLWPHL